MKLKIAAVLLAVVSAFLVLGPTSAQAVQTPAPAAASVSPAITAGTISKWSYNGKADCPAGYFCVWRTTNFGSSPMMGYWTCAEYKLGWHTVGSWYNHQTGNAKATFYNIYHNVWGVTGGPGDQQPSADFRPVYSLKNC
jgi:hypothetical protein